MRYGSAIAVDLREDQILARDVSERELGLPRRKIAFTFFDFARAVLILKGKGNFSARLCSDEQGGGATFPARGQKVSLPLQPLPLFARSSKHARVGFTNTALISHLEQRR